MIPNTLTIEDIRKLIDHYDQMWDYVNRYIILDNVENSLSLLGFHVGNERQFEAVSKSDFSIIACDLNYNHLLKPITNKQKLNYERYCKLLRSYEQLIPEDIITDNQTEAGIDKILIKQKISKKYEYSVWVMDYCFVKEKTQFKLRYSDHNLCICEIK